MTTVGAGWLNESKSGEHQISIKIDKALLPLTISAEKSLIVRPNKNKKESKQPDYYLDLFIPEKKPEQTETGSNEFIF